MIGRRLGRFVVVERIGEGAFSEVFRAKHPAGVAVAVKVARTAGGDAHLMRREAVHLAGFDHPGIVHAYDQGVVDGRPWLALELARGTLSDLDVALPLVGLAHHLLAALAHLHARGVVHRDLKPSNILVGCAPRTGLDAADRAGVRLADFGISWQSEQGDLSRAGTPGWAAPEQLDGIVGPAVDLYAVARVLRAVADERGRRDLDGWFARGLAPDPADRFPSAAHARAALPGDAGRTSVVGLPTDASATRRVEQTPTPLPTETRPVLLSLVVPALDTAPVPIVQPAWPDVPPVPAARVARPRMLDVGLGLLPHRPVLPIGRLELLADLWRSGATGPIRVKGAEEDVREVEAALRTWAQEAGVQPVIERDDVEGVPVPPLASWMLEARAQAVGFEDASARALARAVGSAPGLRALVQELVDAGLVEATEGGLRIVGAVGPLPSVHEATDRALEDAWWAGRALELAGLVAAYALRSDAEGSRLALHRARLEKRTDTPAGERLLEAASRAEETDQRLAHALRVEAAGLFVRAKNADAARAALEGMRGCLDERLVATAALYAGFIAFMQRDFSSASVHLQRATTLAEGRYAALALSTRADVAIHQGEPEAALVFAREARRRVEPGRAEEVVATCCTLALCLVANDASEDDVVEVLREAEAVTPQVTNRSSIGRLMLFKAQSAMRRKDWDRADRLFLRARQLWEASGGSALFAVLNHGLVGLERGDLASIRAITPSTWAAETAIAPPYVRPLMLLHTLYAALGDGDEGAIDRAFAALEGVALPAATRKGIQQAAELMPQRADQLLGLLP